MPWETAFGTHGYKAGWVAELVWTW